MEKDSNSAPSLFFSHFFFWAPFSFLFFFMGSFWPLFFPHWDNALIMMIIILLFTYNSKLQLETRTNMTLYECLWQCTRMCNDTSVTCIKNDERWLSHKYYVSYMIMQSNMTMMMCVI